MAKNGAASRAAPFCKPLCENKDSVNFNSTKV